MKLINSNIRSKLRPKSKQGVIFSSIMSMVFSDWLRRNSGIRRAIAYFLVKFDMIKFDFILPEFSVPMGPRPPHPPQVQRYRSGSSQREPRTVLFTYWLAYDEEKWGSPTPRKADRYERYRKRPHIKILRSVIFCIHTFHPIYDLDSAK